MMGHWRAWEVPIKNKSEHCQQNWRYFYLSSMEECKSFEFGKGVNDDRIWIITQLITNVSGKMSHLDAFLLFKRLWEACRTAGKTHCSNSSFLRRSHTTWGAWKGHKQNYSSKEIEKLFNCQKRKQMFMIRNEKKDQFRDLDLISIWCRDGV